MDVVRIEIAEAVKYEYVRMLSVRGKIAVLIAATVDNFIVTNVFNDMHKQPSVNEISNNIDRSSFASQIYFTSNNTGSQSLLLLFKRKERLIESIGLWGGRQATRSHFLFAFFEIQYYYYIIRGGVVKRIQLLFKNRKNE